MSSITGWDTSSFKDVAMLFFAVDDFDADLSYWDMSNALICMLCWVILVLTMADLLILVDGM